MRVMPQSLRRATQIYGGSARRSLQATPRSRRALPHILPRSPSADSQGQRTATFPSILFRLRGRKETESQGGPARLCSRRVVASSCREIIGTRRPTISRPRFREEETDAIERVLARAGGQSSDGLRNSGRPHTFKRNLGVWARQRSNLSELLLHSR